METIESYVYRDLKKNQILKVRLQDSEDFLYVREVSRQVLQPYQPAWTPIKDIDLLIINDLNGYRENPTETMTFEN